MSNRIISDPNEVAKNQVLQKYRYSARQKGRDFEISEEEFSRITAEPCYYCGDPPGNTSLYRDGRFVYSGLDRTDPSQGYMLENVVPCCTWCNKAKLDGFPDELIAHCAKVVAHCS